MPRDDYLLLNLHKNERYLKLLIDDRIGKKVNKCINLNNYSDIEPLKSFFGSNPEKLSVMESCNTILKKSNFLIKNLILRPV